MRLESRDRRRLLALARESLSRGVAEGRPAEPPVASLSPALKQPAACFVTLHSRQQLRGCIGSLQALEPLAVAVARAAYGAGFQDPRFPPLAAAELPGLELEISVLGPLEPLAVETQDGLIACLRPGVDGLLLEEGGRRSVYLPAVWEQLPDPALFLAQLKRKGGWPADYWSSALRASRFQVTVISEAGGVRQEPACG